MDKNKRISKEIFSFTKNEKRKYPKEYDFLIELWEKIGMGIRNSWFIIDLKISFTNVNAKLAQMGIKVKQKVGKINSEKGFIDHWKIKNLISSVKLRKDLD